MDFTEFFNTLLTYCVSYGGKLILALVIILVGFKVTNVIVRKVKEGKRFQKLDSTAASFLASFISIAVKTVLVITAIAIMGVPMASVVTILATCGAAIGLALQGSLSNFAGGIMLMVFRPFRVEDYIETQGVSGTVRSITIFYTVLTTVDNKDVTLPNGSLMNAAITNYSANEYRRVDLAFNVAYDSDIDRVRDVLASICKVHPMVLDTPETAVLVSKQGENGLEFTVRAWCKKEDYWSVYFDLTEAVKKAFDKTGIDIPYQQVDIHIKDGKIR